MQWFRRGSLWDIFGIRFGAGQARIRILAPLLGWEELSEGCVQPS
jgi:hypothetical protein